MQSLAKDLIYSATTGKMKNSVVRFFMNRDNFHEYLWEYLIPGKDKYFSYSFTTWKKHIPSFLTLDWLFDHYIARSMYVEQMLSVIHYQSNFTHQTDNFKNNLRDALINLNNRMCLRQFLLNEFRKLGIVPMYFHLKFSRYDNKYWGLFKTNHIHDGVIRGDGTEREQYARVLSTFRISKRQKIKIHRIKIYKAWDVLHYQPSFTKPYMEVCEKLNVESVLQLIKI